MIDVESKRVSHVTMGSIQTLGGNREGLTPAGVFEACRNIVESEGVAECRRLLALLMEKHQIPDEERVAAAAADFLTKTVGKNKTTPDLDQGAVIAVNELYAPVVSDVLSRERVEAGSDRMRRLDRIHARCLDIHLAALRITGLEHALKQQAVAKKGAAVAETNTDFELSPRAVAAQSSSNGAPTAAKPTNGKTAKPVRAARAQDPAPAKPADPADIDVMEWLKSDANESSAIDPKDVKIGPPDTDGVAEDDLKIDFGIDTSSTTPAKK